jgi:hypothetical protein
VDAIASLTGRLSGVSASVRWTSSRAWSTPRSAWETPSTKTWSTPVSSRVRRTMSATSSSVDSADGLIRSTAPTPAGSRP